jgi:hypothetical protein
MRPIYPDTISRIIADNTRNLLAATDRAHVAADAFSAPFKELTRLAARFHDLHRPFTEPIQCLNATFARAMGLDTRRTSVRRPIRPDDPPPARLTRQQRYNYWVACFEAEHGRTPNRGEDRKWAKANGIPVTRVAVLRANCPNLRLHKPGPRPQPDLD